MMVTLSLSLLALLLLGSVASIALLVLYLA